MDGDRENRQRRALGAAQLLDQVARRIHEKRGQDDLHAVQWSALRYFARSGRRTATVSGLSRYLGNTSGSTSRTAQSLVQRGLIDQAPSDHDLRMTTFTLTRDGRAKLAEDPLNDVAVLLASVAPEKLAILSDVLDQLHGSLGETRKG